MWTMGIKLVLSLLLIAIAVECKVTYIPLDCAEPVEKCPIDKTTWAKRNEILKCKAFYGYVCLRDSQGFLVETCMVNYTITANTSNCPVLFDCINGVPHLGTKSAYYTCPKELTGCPPKHHDSYSIYMLYKYPRCIESNLTTIFEETSSDLTESVVTTAAVDPDQNTKQESSTLVIPFLFAFLLIAVVIIISACAFVWKKKMEDSGRNAVYHHVPERDTQLIVYHQLPDSNQSQPTDSGRIVDSAEGTGGNTDAETFNERCPVDDLDKPEGEEIRALRSLILGINKAEAGKVQILPFKINEKMDNKIDVDCIYVQVSMKDECETSNNSTHEGKISSKIQEEMFNVHPGKQARFVFLLGEAGYGKTVECQRIANSWCKVWEDETNSIIYTDVEKALKKFEFLFFIRMRNVNKDKIHIEDIICDAYRSYHNDVTSDCQSMIRDILKDKRRRCLVLLDGLDEWKYNSKIKDDLLQCCIPNYTDMPKCTILISMRSWKFIEVEPLFRRHFDKIVTLKGLNDEDIKNLAENMYRHYSKQENDSNGKNDKNLRQENLQPKYDKFIDAVSSDSFQLKSLIHIPLLLALYILATLEDVDPGYSQTTFFLSVIEAFIKRSLRTKQIEQPKADSSDKTVNGTIQDYSSVTKFMPQLQELGQVAFKSLTSETWNLDFREEQLNKQLGEETVDLFLRIGLVIQSETSGKYHEDNVKVSFLHKTIQEFLASLYIYYGREENEIMEFVENIVTDVDKALEYSPVLSFIAGLSPHVGCRISQLIKEMTTHDDDVQKYREGYHHKSYQKVFNLYNLQLRCYREVRGSQYITDSEVKDQYKFSDIILLSSDTDIPTIRESVEVLKHHANDIVSLNMVCIPDNEEEGISKAEVKNFLDKSQSIESIYIDGYVEAQCRLFNECSISRLKTLGLRNVAFTNNILADLITKEEAIGGICALGLLYIKSAEDKEIEFEYRIPSIHGRQTTELGYKRKSFPKNTSESSCSLRKQTTPLLRKLLEILPKYNVLKILHITYMEADDDREMLLQVLPELRQLKSIGYSGSSIFPKPTCNHQYDANVCSKIIQLESVNEVGLYSISLKTSVLNFEKIAKLEKVSLECFTMHSADDWRTFFKSVSNSKSLEKVILYDTDITEDVSNEYKQKLKSREVSVEIYKSKDW